LYEQISSRRSELAAALADSPLFSERSGLLADALALLEIHLEAGWRNLGPRQLDELTEWLEQTHFLVEKTDAAVLNYLGGSQCSTGR
jgi:hypothetical protein